MDQSNEDNNHNKKPSQILIIRDYLNRNPLILIGSIFSTVIALGAGLTSLLNSIYGPIWICAAIIFSGSTALAVLLKIDLSKEAHNIDIGLSIFGTASMAIGITIILFSFFPGITHYCCDPINSLRETQEAEEEPIEETETELVSTQEIAEDAEEENPPPATVKVNMPCLLADSTIGWSSPGGERDPVYHDCYKQGDRGFEASINEDTGKPELILGCGDKEDTCIIDTNYRGISTIIDPGKYEFHVYIDSIGIDKQAYQSFLNSNKQTPSPPVDVDLIIGIGNPQNGTGKFAFFRQIGPGGPIHFCVRAKTTAYCEREFFRDPEDFGQPEKVVIEILDDLSVKFYTGEDNTYFNETEDQLNFRAPSPLSLWIGYGINLEGHILATVEFPEELGYLLLKDED